MEDSWNRPDMPDKETKSADYGVPEPPVYEYDYGVPKTPGAGYGAQETQNAETSADSGTQGAQEYVSAETASEIPEAARPEFGEEMPEYGAEMPYGAGIPKAESSESGAEIPKAETPEYGSGMLEAEMPGADAKTAEPETPKNTPPRQDYYADGTPVRPRNQESGSQGYPQTGYTSQGYRYGNPGPQNDSRQGTPNQPGDSRQGTPSQTDPQHPYRQYQYGSEWQRRQIAPQPYGKDPKKNGKGSLIAAIAIVVAIGIFGGAAFAGIKALSGKVTNPKEFAEPSEELDLPEPETAQAEPKKPAPTLIPAAPSENTGSSSAQSSGMSVADVAEMSMPAMVSITTMSVQQVYSFFGEVENREVPTAGSGIIVGQTDTELLVATNDHVIAGAKQLSVCFVDEEVVEGVVKGTDVQNDLAIVAVRLEDIADETKEKIRVISIGDSDSVRIGEQVVAIGNALGFGQSVSAGVISALNRNVKLEDGDHVLMQTDAAINPGNSGGALLNMNGELIGINEVKYVAEDTEGIGYAIPITFAEPILNELMNRETRTKAPAGESGYLGITCITVTEDYSKAYRIPTGVFVDSVVEGEAADKAGIRPRDIITKIGDITVTTSDMIVDELQYYKAGENVTVTISRLMDDNEYQEIEVSVTLSKRPADLDQQQGSSGQQGSQDNGSDSGNPWRIPGGNR